jgi:hypothetical protein
VTPQQAELVEVGSESELRAARGKLLKMMALPLLIFLAGEAIWGSSALLTAPPLWANLVFISIGIAYFYWLSRLMIQVQELQSDNTQMSLFQKISIIVFLPAVLMPYVLRLGIEIVSFAATSPPIVERELMILGSSGGKSAGKWLDVGFVNGEGRDPRARVTDRLHDMYWHITTYKKDCVLMPTQTGRWNVVRVIRPTYWSTPLDIDKLRLDCANGRSNF